MPSIKELPCWEIMKCSQSTKCPARHSSGQACWEIVRELEDYRVEYDICPDCIVYMVKNEALTLSAHDLNQARERGHCSCTLSAVN